MNPPEDRPLNASEVTVIGSPTGAWVHLLEQRERHTADDPKTLCGNKAAKKTSTWFALNGCKRCCKAGWRRGLTEIVDVDGKIVRLQDVLDGVVRD